MTIGAGRTLGFDVLGNRARWLCLSLVGFAVAVLSACGGGDDGPETRPETTAPQEPPVTLSHPDPDESGVGPAGFEGDEGFEAGRFATIFLAPHAAAADTAALTGRVDAILTNSEFSYTLDLQEPYLDLSFEPGLFEDHPGLLPCFRYDGAPHLNIELKEPDPALLRSVADALHDDPLVVGMESFGLDLGYSEIPDEFATDEEGRHLGYDEYLAEECFGYRVSVITDGSLDADSLRRFAEEILALPAVAAVLVEPSFDDEGEFFSPDLSDYPDMAPCFSPETSSITAVIPEGDRASSDAVIDAFHDDERVLGFFGRYVDESLDPYLAFEQEADAFFERCERMTADVELAVDISDADAAVVVARVLDVPGVADIELNLFDPEPREGCEEFEGEGEILDPPPDAWGSTGGGSLNAPGRVARSLGAPIAALSEPIVDPCFVPETSSLTIYRGDPDLASQPVLADAICDLPGVLSIFSFDEIVLDLDPYDDCMPLFLEVRLAFDAGEQAKQAVFDLLEASPDVAGVDHFAGYAEAEGFEPLIPEIVVGDVDVFACDPELAYGTGSIVVARLHRMSEPAARAFADELLALPGVADVYGSAVRRELYDENGECGHEYLSFWFTPEATESQRAAVFDVFASRPDVAAVGLVAETYEGAHVGTPTGSVDVGWSGSVWFTAEEPPADLEALIEQIRALPGVAHTESFVFGDEFHGDVFEGDVEGDREDFEGTP